MISKDIPLRYALYFAPSHNDPLSETAAGWLGRDAFTGEALSAAATDHLDIGDHALLTADPRRYGFHATIKAPFALAASVTEREFLQFAGEFAKRTAAFAIPEMVLGQIDHFFALVPAAPYQPLQDFAAKVVKSFEPFRAGLSEADIARRRPERLSEAERANLMRWGYPYVMDEFRFHMTLTGAVPAERQPAVGDILRKRFAAHIGRPLAISGIAVFIEETRGAPFTVHSWLPLAGAPN